MNLGAIHSSTHAGTHADAPLHVRSDWSASESLPPSAFVGEVCVVALPDEAAGTTVITRALLETLLHTSASSSLHDDVSVPRRLLCRTGHSVARGEFPEAWPVLEDATARWMVDSGLLLFGTDAPSVDSRESKTLPVHHALFGRGAYVLENLSLAHVAPGMYELLAQPILVKGADAAPVRALLRERPTASR